MGKVRNQLAAMINNHTKSLKRDLQNSFTEIPIKACNCGKPIVFVSGKRTFYCTRCNRRWRLVVDVQEITSKNKA